MTADQTATAKPAKPTPPPVAYDMATGRPVPDPSKPVPEPKSIRLG